MNAICGSATSKVLQSATSMTRKSRGSMCLTTTNIHRSSTKVFFSTGGTAGFQSVGCVGLGLMGHGICQVAASSDVHSKVIAYEKEQRFLDAGYVEGWTSDPQNNCRSCVYASVYACMYALMFV
jgi:hypothetical protein